MFSMQNKAYIPSFTNLRQLGCGAERLTVTVSYSATYGQNGAKPFWWPVYQRYLCGANFFF